MLTLVLAPGKMEAGVRAVLFCRHRTASVYDFRCAGESDPLEEMLGKYIQTVGI